MKLTTTTQLTVDGVIQGNGASDDDRRNGFERGGWAFGKGDDETRTFINQTFQRADAFLFGRWTTVFDPAGYVGILYWYLLYPVHHRIFGAILRGLSAAKLDPPQEELAARL